jgi:hypothetical protein
MDLLSLSTCLAESPKFAILVCAPGVKGTFACALFVESELCGRAIMVALDELDDTLRCSRSRSRPLELLAGLLLLRACC